MRRLSFCLLAVFTMLVPIAAAYPRGGTTTSTAGELTPGLVCSALRQSSTQASLDALSPKLGAVQERFVLTAIAGSATTSCPALTDRAIEVSTALIGRRLNGFVAPAAGAALLFEPGQAIPLGAQIGATTVPVKAYWTSISSGAPASYAVGLSSGGAYAPVGLSSPAATSQKVTVATGSAYRFRLAARQGAGTDTHTGPWGYARPFAAGIYDESSAGGITYRGAWQRQARPDSHGGAVRYTGAKGATVSFHFTGVAVAWIGPRYSSAGIADVSLDGAPAGSVNPSGSSDREVLWSRVWPTPATHTVTITFDPGSRGGSSIALDAFVVLA